MSDRGYDVWVLNTDTCSDCGQTYWFGEPCGCPEEVEEEEE